MKGFCLEVSGDFACFTRPEMKVERVSYDVITPSAARAIYEAIFWKPAIQWHITKIEVLNPIRWTSIRRNEVGSVVLPKGSCIYIEEDRQQRAGLILKDVRYRLHAYFDFIPPGLRSKVKNPFPEWLRDQEEKECCESALCPSSVRKDETEAKYAAIFTRRATKGQYFNRPYLGCREFSCNEFRLVKLDELKSAEKPIDDSRDFGYMLYDMDFSDPKNITPMFYRARMEKGVIEVPRSDSEEVVR